jgi:predicted PolB exonuclease-like 3'-5' exonuclease
MSLLPLTFVDIETVPCELPQLSIELSNLFDKKFRKEVDELPIKPGIGYNYEARQELWDQKAGLHAEFGKIVAISIGKLVIEPEHPKGNFYIRTMTSRNESELLTQATASFAKAGGTLVAHNGLEFDFPYLMRRYMINGLSMPAQLDTSETKPWDVKLRDTMKMWSGTAWNYKVSLELLCHILNVPSPKTGISGEDVAKLYYDKDDNLKKIGEYCAGDVLACAQVYCRMKGLPLIDKIEYV